MSDNLNDRLEQNGLTSTPQTKPDERRKYLGSLRERVLVRMSVLQLKNAELVKTFILHIPEFTDYQVLINNKVSTGNSSLIIKTCSQNNMKFSLISDQTAQTNDSDTGLLVVAKDAINEPIIDIEQKYEVPKPDELSHHEKRSLWDKLKRIFKGV